jgi:hypothetical protein
MEQLQEDVEEKREELRGVYNRGKQKARQKYPERLKAVRSAYKTEKGQKLPKNLEAVLGTCLENTSGWVKEQISQKGAVATEQLTSSDLGTFIRHGFDLVSAIIPTSIANDIISVQPMDRELGKAFYLDYTYSSNKGDVNAGDVAYDAKTGANTDPTYASEFIKDEPVGASGQSQYTGSVRYTPVIKNQVAFQEVDSSGTIVQEVTDDGNGNLTGDVSGGGTNSIDYSSGDYDFTFAQSTSNNVVVDYKTDFEASTGNIPRMKFKINEQNLQAEDRKLIVNWLLDASFRMEQYFGEDVEQLLVGLLAGAVRAEQDQYILDNLLNAAQTANTGQFDATTKIQHSQNTRNEDFINTVNDVKGQIEDQTGHMTASWMAAGSGVISLIRGLEEFSPVSTSEEDRVGPHKVGEVYSLDVYKVRAYNDDQYVMGARGNNFLRAGALWAPFIPIMVTDTYFTQNLEKERGVLSSAAHEILNDGAFVRGTVKLP